MRTTDIQRGVIDLGILPQVAVALTLIIAGLLLWYVVINVILDWFEDKQFLPRRWSKPYDTDDTCKWFDCPLSDHVHSRKEHESWLPKKRN